MKIYADPAQAKEIRAAAKEVARVMVKEAKYPEKVSDIKISLYSKPGRDVL